MKCKNITQNIIFTAVFAVLLSLFGTFSAFAETLPSETSQATNVSSSYVTSTPNTARTLPEVELDDIVVPQVIGAVDEKDTPSLTSGFIFWIVIGVMIAVILAVIFTSKTKAFRSGGKKRYSTGDKMSSSRHLLNEKYYHKHRK